MTSKLKFVRALLAAGTLLFSAACGTTQFNGYESATAEDKKIVAAGGFSEAATAQIVIVQNKDFNGGMISPKALRKIQEYSMECQEQIDAQLAGAGQSAVNGALPYGAAGLGTGPAAAAAGFTNAAISAGNYAVYSGGAYLLPGAVNGLVTGSYAMASAKGTCTRDFWEDISKTDPDFKGTHVVVAYAGKRSNSRPPALNRSAVVPASLKK